MLHAENAQITKVLTKLYITRVTFSRSEKIDVPSITTQTKQLERAPRELLFEWLLGFVRQILTQSPRDESDDLGLLLEIRLDLRSCEVT